MKIKFVDKTVSDVKSDGLVLFTFEDVELRSEGLPSELMEYLNQEAFASGEFSAKKNELLVLPVHSLLPNIKRVILVGLGKQKDVSFANLRDAFGKAVKEGEKRKAKRLSCWIRPELAIHNDWTQLGETLAVAGTLATYRFDQFKKSDDESKPPEELNFLGHLEKGKKEFKRGLKEAQAIAEGVVFARNLANFPANELPPRKLAREAERMAEGFGLSCTILQKKDMKELNMNALLGVAQGSNEEPRLIVVQYYGGDSAEQPFVLVGKGVTFDSGGISLKPSKSMDEMKFDMSGGAAVLGTLKAVAALKLPVNVIGIIPAVENMPGGTATRPGDVLRSMSGKTIEVLNTDAEGRLILADALTYAERYNPEAVVDVATLTGAIVVALGHEAAGLMGNDDHLIDELRKASEQSGEKVWPFPLYDEYKEQLKSTIADIKNIGSSGGGVVTAGTFLKAFTEKYSWAHLDIAGVAWTTKDLPVCPKGATGFGVYLLSVWLRSKARK